MGYGIDFDVTVAPWLCVVCVCVGSCLCISDPHGVCSFVFLYLCISSLLVVDLPGLWRGLKPRKLVTWQWGPWRA